MEKNDALISTALLKAFQESRAKDYLDIIKPFVINIIEEKYKIGEIVETTYIQKKLREDYSFKDFPIAVITKVLKKLYKEGIIKKDKQNNIFAKNVSDEAEVFKKTVNETKREIKYVLNGIQEYIKQEDGREITETEAEAYLSTFVEMYGYKAYRNFMSLCTKIDRKKETINYLIGELITNEFCKKSVLFDYILKIIEGHMLANMIYLQIDGSTKPSLRGIKCYLDSPLILKIFGYKTDEENESGKELHSLLKNYGATMKCFYHTYDEVERILNNYKAHINESREVTLEYFDKMSDPLLGVDLAIKSLESTFKEYGIIIEERPTIDSRTKAYNINYALLEQKLKDYKDEHKFSYTERTIENDVNSVCSISILRKGNYPVQLEKCNYIFITPFYYLVKATDEITGVAGTSRVGLAINDLDLTTILWFKDLKKNSEIPKMRLIENARAATMPSAKLMSKAISIFDNMMENNLIPGLDGALKTLSSTYLEESGYLGEVKNDDEKVNDESFSNYFKRVNERNKELEITAEREAVKNIKAKENFINIVNEEAHAIYKKWLITLNIVTILVITIICVGIIICGVYTKAYSFASVPVGIISIVNILGACLIFLPNRFINKKIKIIAKNKERNYKAKKMKEIEKNFDVDVK